MPPAARITDNHVCPKVEPGPVPHVGGPVIVGEPTVLIGNKHAARMGEGLRLVGEEHRAELADHEVERLLRLPGGNVALLVPPRRARVLADVDRQRVHRRMVGAVPVAPHPHAGAHVQHGLRRHAPPRAQAVYCTGKVRDLLWGDFEAAAVLGWRTAVS